MTIVERIGYKLSYWWDENWPIVMAMMCFPAVFALILAILWGVVAYDCIGYERATSATTRTAGFTCYVQTKDGWISMAERVARQTAADLAG